MPITDIYTQVAEIVSVFCESRDLKTIKEKLEHTDNKKVIEILSFAYDTSDLNALAILIHKQEKYYEETGDINYLVGSQPLTQKYYIDLDQPASQKNKWKQFSSISQQSEITIPLKPKDKEDLLAIAEEFEKLVSERSWPALSTLSNQLIIPISRSLMIASIDNIIDFLELIEISWLPPEEQSVEYKNLIETEIQLSLKSFSDSDRELFLQCDALYSYLKNPSETISRNEYTLLMAVLPKVKKAQALHALLRTEKYDTKSPTSVWTTSHHGRGLDVQHKVAGSKNSIKLVIKDGILFTFNPKDKSFSRATTKKLSYKGTKNNAGLIITLDGSIHMFNHTRGKEVGDKHFHSMVTGGKGVLFAGSIQVVNGHITQITDTSGHYQPVYTLELILFLSEKNLLNPNIQYLNSCKILQPIQEMFNNIIDSPSGKASIRKYIKQHGIEGFYKIFDAKQETCNKLDEISAFMMTFFIEYQDILIAQLTPYQIKSDHWKSLLTEFIINITNGEQLTPEEKLEQVDALRKQGFDVDNIIDPNTDKFCVEIITNQHPLLQHLSSKSTQPMSPGKHQAVEAQALQPGTKPAAPPKAFE